MLSRVFGFGFGRRPFESLSEQEILALAISSEEDDGRIYRAYADGLAESFPQSAKVFEEMAEDLTAYTYSKGSLRFPVDEPLPQSVVNRLIEIRLHQAGP